MFFNKLGLVVSALAAISSNNAFAGTWTITVVNNSDYEYRMVGDQLNMQHRQELGRRYGCFNLKELGILTDAGVLPQVVAPKTSAVFTFNEEVYNADCFNIERHVLISGFFPHVTQVLGPVKSFDLSDYNSILITSPVSSFGPINYTSSKRDIRFGTKRAYWNKTSHLDCHAASFGKIDLTLTVGSNLEANLASPQCTLESSFSH